MGVSSRSTCHFRGDLGRHIIRVRGRVEGNSFDKYLRVVIEKKIIRQLDEKEYSNLMILIYICQ